jgi:metal transporter CNNM
MDVLVWVGIILCLSQSALFSGLTIGFFGLSRLRLEVESATKDRVAIRILQLRKDSNFLLATLLWGNVGVNVLLTLLTDSLLTGISAFCVSTFAITIFGEILPQAYLSRNAMRVGAALIPVIKFYQVLFYPIAKPTAFVLDLWLGKEGIQYFLEDEIIALIKQHIKALDSNVDLIEGLGAINFLTLDDVKVVEEGERVDPNSIVQLTFNKGKPVFPDLSSDMGIKLIERINKTDKKWVVITDAEEKARFVLNADALLRGLSKSPNHDDPMSHCHKPILVTKRETTIGETIRRFTVNAEHPKDDVIDQDIILFWNQEKRVITGADILGRLLRGIVRTEEGEKTGGTSEPFR